MALQPFSLGDTLLHIILCFLYFLLENYDVLPEELDFDILEFGVDGDLEVVAKRREGLNPPCTVRKPFLKLLILFYVRL